ncbi:MAG: hypothetical protein KDB90_04505 [Planctomycetes bacterium]|nr:hypothetical protein [Planctomycetota bacterium]
MRIPVSRCLPALVAAFLLAVLPGCASLNDPLMEATIGELHERGRPVINHELKEVVAGAPTCITRGAGMDFDPPACDGDLWPLALFYLLVYLGYAIGYCFYKLGEQIWEACNSPDANEEKKAAPPETQPEPQSK